MQVPIASLFLDPGIWPRHKLSETNVASIREALLAGVEMPPILVDQKSLRVIDGVHRVTAFERLYGPEYLIECEEKVYKSRRQMIEDAMSLNVGRGENISRWDITRCILLAEEVSIPITTLARLIHWEPERLKAYRDSRLGSTLDDRKVMLKRTIRRHLNKPLTKAQEEVNAHASGMQPLFHINQIRALLETDLMPTEDHIRAELRHLGELIEVWLTETEHNVSE